LNFNLSEFLWGVLSAQCNKCIYLLIYEIAINWHWGDIRFAENVRIEV